MTMARTRKAKTPETPVENLDKEPVNLEVTASEEPVAAPVAQPSKEIQTDVRAKLAKKTDEENIFIPTNPAALEKAASQVAQEQGFELNRGTSIGARLLARAQKKV